MTYQWQFNGADIAGATRSTLTLTNVESTHNGNFRLMVRNGFGTTPSSNALLAVLLPVDRVLATPGLVWITVGDALWFGEPTLTHTHEYAAQSGLIRHDQKSVLSASVTGPGILHFWWRVSSEPGWDMLQFRISGVELARISGEMDWEQRSFGLSAGTLTLEWIYSKDFDTSAGLDAAWVEAVSFTPSWSPTLLSISYSGTSFNTSVLTVSGKTYALEYKRALTDLQWDLVTSLVGDGTIKMLTDTNAVGPQRFYRVRPSD